MKKYGDTNFFDSQQLLLVAIPQGIEGKEKIDDSWN
jgi:hypothetical protein